MHGCFSFSTMQFSQLSRTCAPQTSAPHESLVFLRWSFVATYKCICPFEIAEQDRQVEAMRTELSDLEEKLREANEMELPDEDLRIATEEKRAELNLLVKGFHELNLKEPNERTSSTTTAADRSKDRAGGNAGGGSGKASGVGGAPGGSSAPPLTKFERPSERRRRLEQQMRDTGGEYQHGGGSYGGGGGGGRRYNNQGDGGRGDDSFSSFGGDRRGGRGGGGGGGGGYDRGGGRGYSDEDKYGGGRVGNRSNNDSYNDKHAGDRYNF